MIHHTYINTYINSRSPVQRARWPALPCRTPQGARRHPYIYLFISLSLSIYFSMYVGIYLSKYI